MSKQKPVGASDDEVIAMLKRYKCPTPFHEVRTRFLGNIASPILDTSVTETIRQLWGGELPEFDSEDDANALFNVLLAGLWNRLTEHQSGLHPFRLLRFEVTQTRNGLKHLVQVRRQELDGFVEGLFGRHEHIDLPERAHEALGVLSELRIMLAGAVDVLDDPGKSANPDDIKKLLQNIQRMTIIAETEINKVNISCKRARSKALEAMPATKPTLH